MTVANENLQSALNKHLSIATPTIGICYENVEYNPVVGESYLRAWLLPGETTSLTLGPGNILEYLGVYQIDILCPKDQGWAPAKVKAGKLLTHFRPGISMTYQNLTVKSWKAYCDSGSIDGDFYKVSVSVEYRAWDVNN